MRVPAIVLSTLIAAQPACYQRETSIRVRDLSQVSVYARTTRGTDDPVLAAGALPDRRPYAWDVWAVRADGPRLGIECSSCEFGKASLAGPGPTIGPYAGRAATLLKAPELRVSAGRYVVSSAYSPPIYQYRYVEPVLGSPWTNVAELREKRTPVRMVGWMLFPGAIMTAVGFLVLPYSTGWGAYLLIPGLTLDGVGAWHLWAPARETVYQPPR